MASPPVNGHGEFTFSSGGKYSGEWLSSTPHGRGTMEGNFAECLRAITKLIECLRAITKLIECLRAITKLIECLRAITKFLFKYTVALIQFEQAVTAPDTKVIGTSAKNTAKEES